jgi:hypothetical protein
MPGEGLVDSDGPDEGALCWALEPVDGSLLIPVPCAFAKPVPAISAAAATEIIRRLVMEISPHMFCTARPTTKANAGRSLAPSGSFTFVS